jgi:hypothetical protein
MTFDPKYWVRLEYDGIPIYLRGDKPNYLYQIELATRYCAICCTASVQMGTLPFKGFLHI